MLGNLYRTPMATNSKRDYVCTVEGRYNQPSFHAVVIHARNSQLDSRAQQYDYVCWADHQGESEGLSVCVFNFTASAAGLKASDGTISRSEHNQPTDYIYI